MLVLGVTVKQYYYHYYYVCIYLFGGPLWPYTYAPALAKKLVLEH